MEDPLSQRERLKYEKIWEDLSEYREDSDFHMAALFVKEFEKEFSQGEAVIDFGCGTGRSCFSIEKKPV